MTFIALAIGAVFGFMIYNPKHNAFASLFSLGGKSDKTLPPAEIPQLEPPEPDGTIQVWAWNSSTIRVQARNGFDALLFTGRLFRKFTSVPPSVSGGGFILPAGTPAAPIVSNLFNWRTETMLLTVFNVHPNNQANVNNVFTGG